MARILGIDLPWDPAGCNRDEITIDNGAGPLVSLGFDQTIAQRQVYIDRMAKLLGGDGADWDRAFRWGEDSNLIGRPLSNVWRVGDSAASQPAARPDSPTSRFDPGVEMNPVLRQRGTVSGLGAGAPLAVGVNGRIAAVGQTYDDNGKIRYSILLPQSSLRSGGNRIEIFSIDNPMPALRPLWSSNDQ
jgi:hypothetical protein